MSEAPPRRRLDAFELSLLALMGALSLWVIASDLVEASVRHVVWTHTDGFFAGDQLQYLAWIRSAAAHGLVSDLYVLRHTPADYLQPAIMISALLVRLGVAPWLSLLVWKPVAVVMIVLAMRAIADHCLAVRFDRRIALVLGVLYCSLTVSTAGKLGIFFDMVSGWQSWGYPFGLIGVALIVFGLLRYARARDRGRVTAVPGLLGALAGIVHPWQGEMMFLVVVLGELVRLPATRAGPRTPTLRLAGLTVILLALPLLYFFGLGHFDAVWREGQANAKHAFSSRAVLIAAAPLLLVALLGYRGRPADFLELTLRLWPLATLIIWVFALSSLGATPQHAVNGLPLDLAVLAVLGVRRSAGGPLALARLPHGRGIAVLATALVVVPGTVFMLADAHTYTDRSPGNADYVTPGEHRALAWLGSRSGAGGVLTELVDCYSVP